MSSYDWSSLNKTELAAVAREFNGEAHRDLPEWVLVTVIESEIELPVRHVNKKRLSTMQHLNTNWVSLGPLIKCPATSRDPRACFGCTDNQVACCVIDNIKLFNSDD